MISEKLAKTITKTKGTGKFFLEYCENTHNFPGKVCENDENHDNFRNSCDPSLGFPWGSLGFPRVP